MAVSPKDPGDRIQIGSKRKIAFVCSGGATKAGAFHLGVALALQEQGFRFYGGLKAANSATAEPGPMDISTYVGSSAGSIISCYLAAGYSLDNIFNSFLGRKPINADPADLTPKILPKLTYQKMFKLRPKLAAEQLSQIRKFRGSLSSLIEGSWEALFQFKWLKMSGLFSTAGIEQYMREEVLPSNRFQDYAADLFIVGTQLNDSSKVIFGKRNHPPVPQEQNSSYDNSSGISEACAASTALPVIFAPYGIRNTDGKVTYYIDGEIRDTLSTHVAVDEGADLVIASYTHQPYHLPPHLSMTDHGLPAIVIQSIYLLIEQKINSHIHNKRIQRSAIQAVSEYCSSHGLTEHRDRICQLLEKELNHRRNVDTIYVHPDPHDAHLFFGDHFSLSPAKMADIVKSGFRSAIEALRQYEFADRQKKHSIGLAAQKR